MDEWVCIDNWDPGRTLNCRRADLNWTLARVSDAVAAASVIELIR